MKSDDLIHLKFEYEEALESKKNILNSEKSLMIIAKTMERYFSLRTEELKEKIKLHKKMRGTIASIKNLQRVIPQVETPKALKKESEKNVEIRPKKRKYEDNIESQLQEIQGKLNALQKQTK